jgi:hypothetical protein
MMDRSKRARYLLVGNSAATRSVPPHGAGTGSVEPYTAESISGSSWVR